jgi:hypothetical protein
VPRANQNAARFRSPREPAIAPILNFVNATVVRARAAWVPFRWSLRCLLRPGLKSRAPRGIPELPILALMYDLERIPVGVENIGGIVSRIVFQSCAGRSGFPCFIQKNAFLPSPNPHRSG